MQSIQTIFLKFFIYGLLGLCIEVLWTGFGSLMKKDWKMSGNTYLWMLPIYGITGLLFEGIYNRISYIPWVIRGIIWMSLIFFIEYISGRIIKQIIGVCPWDYSSNTKYSVRGFIRIDYAPEWFAVGLIFEQICTVVNKLII